MAETGVRIDLAANGTAGAVAAARRALQTNNRSLFRSSRFAKREAVFAAPAVAVDASMAAAVVADATAAPAVEAPGVATTAAGKGGWKFKSIGAAAGKPAQYALMTLLLLTAGMAGVWKANVAFAPEMYDDQGMVPVAAAHAEGKNYAVFDLNLNIRRWKEELVARFASTPDVVILGASHWQEAHAGLVKSERMFNGHVHRDYWEDLLGVVEVYARNNRMPKRMIIAIRDYQFKPLEDRTDYLWEPGIPNYRKMADRLGLPKEDAWKTYPWQRMKERLSLTMLFNNVTRWFNASEYPHATAEKHFEHLDILLPDGSILWSGDHRAIFTQERAKREALKLADYDRQHPPKIDKKGVEAFDALLGYLKKQGVQVVLVHPPFNPIFYDAVKGSPYIAALDHVRGVAKDMAAKYGLHIIGDFDPAKVGCTPGQYIDAEHSNPACLQNIFNEYETLLPQLKREARKVKP